MYIGDVGGVYYVRTYGFRGDVYREANGMCITTVFVFSIRVMCAYRYV